MSGNRPIHVLMLGWESPPYISGGLGTACHGLIQVLKVDFWDIDQMANKMIAVLKHVPLRDILRVHGRSEARAFPWEDAAAAIERIYSAHD